MYIFHSVILSKAQTTTNNWAVRFNQQSFILCIFCEQGLSTSWNTMTSVSSVIPPRLEFLLHIQLSSVHPFNWTPKNHETPSVNFDSLARTQKAADTFYSADI